MSGEQPEAAPQTGGNTSPLLGKTDIAAVSEGEIHTHKLDSNQLTAILERLQRPPPRLDTGRLLNLIQMCSILVGAIWALYEFKSFRRESSELSLAQARFAVQQQEVSKQQQELSLKISEVNLALQKKQDALSAVALDKAEEKRLHFNANAHSTLLQEDGEIGLFQVQLTYELKNLADRKFEIEYSVFELFMTEISMDTLDEMHAITIDPPPGIAEGHHDQNTDFKWTRIGGVAHVNSDHYLQWEFKNAYPHPIIGGGGTITLRSGEGFDASKSFYVKVNRKAHFGIVVTIGLKGGRYELIRFDGPFEKNPLEGAVTSQSHPTSPP